MRLLLLLAVMLPLAAPVAAGPGDRGSALAIPYLTSPDLKSTRVKLANTGDVAYDVRINLIDGGLGGFWEAVELTCPLPPAGSLLLEFTHLAPTPFPRVDTTCGGVPTARFVPSEVGLVWVALQDPATNQTVSDDVLIGSAVVIDGTFGTAYSLEAVAFGKGTGPNDGDLKYEFDGVEYVAPPLIQAASFRPDLGLRRPRVILAVIDGLINFAQEAQVNLEFVDRDATRFSSAFTYSCFQEVLLSDIDPRINDSFLGGQAHIRMTPAPRFGDGKRVAFLAWIVEEIQAGFPVEPGGPTMAVSGASGRALRWTGGPFVPPAGEPAPALKERR